MFIAKAFTNGYIGDFHCLSYCLTTFTIILQSCLSTEIPNMVQRMLYHMLVQCLSVCKAPYNSSLLRGQRANQIRGSMSGQYPVIAAIWLIPGAGVICSIWEQNSFKLQCWHEQSGWAVFIVKNWVRSATNQGARFLRIPGRETIKHIVIVWSWSFGVQNECQEIQNHVMLSYPCPLKTSCDSSTTFQTLRLLSRPPDVAARSRLRLSIAVTLSWWPNLQMKK